MHLRRHESREQVFFLVFSFSVRKKESTGSRLRFPGITKTFFFIFLSETMLEVHLKAPRYVLLNRNATLKCEYNVPFNHIHKVEWLKGDKKIFQYVKGRNPPFYNHTITGGKISVSMERRESRWEKKESINLSISVEEEIYELLVGLSEIFSSIFFPLSN